MLSKIINEFKEQGEKVSQYRQGLELLKKSGFIDLLRKFGYPNVIDSGNNPHAMATEAAVSHGYQKAVSHLEFFMEMYLLKAENKDVKPTFGAEKIVLAEKYLTKEEIEKLKGGKI